ncbi:hypothetical protein NST83_06980 [Paenibacillus sp. FSL R10-2782]|uniref:hypothetical protein n=1 Tax=Paenibacillus sp. FSL R10-2782 TaxID=2954661 RepID=UPI0031598E5A
MTKQMMNRTLCGHLAHSQQDKENEGRKRPCSGLSLVQFTRRFQTVVGLTAIRYVTALRLEKAWTLLLETEYTLDYIGKNADI